MPDSFKVGDLVVLKSGGPKMTVTHTEGGRSGIIITTAWFAGSKNEGGRFPVDALVIAPPDQKKIPEPPVHDEPRRLLFHAIQNTPRK